MRARYRKERERELVQADAAGPSRRQPQPLGANASPCAEEAHLHCLSLHSEPSCVPTKKDVCHCLSIHLMCVNVLYRDQSLIADSDVEIRCCQTWLPQERRFAMSKCLPCVPLIQLPEHVPLSHEHRFRWDMRARRPRLQTSYRCSVGQP
jgi:hypothetical protein